MKLTILNIDYHRNGICGAPFHAIVFRDTGPEGSAKLGIVFDEPRHTAVLDIAKLADCDIEFGSNSWRGDQYEPGLRRAIADREKTIESRTSGTGADTGKPNRSIGIVWETQHVKDQRPDLTEEQAWEVLQACEHDRLSDPMLETIRVVAEKLYPHKRKASPSRVARIIADYEPNGDERENLVDLLADAMHWCESFGEPFEEFCGTARMHFEAEAQTYRKGA